MNKDLDFACCLAKVNWQLQQRSSQEGDVGEESNREVLNRIGLTQYQLRRKSVNFPIVVLHVMADSLGNN